MSTYSQILVANFGAAKTGQGTNVGYKVIDAAGTTRIARTTASITEENDAAGNATTGIYRTVATFDTSWSFPVRILWDITGQVGVAAEESLDVSANLIKAKTDLIPTSPAAVGSAMTLDLTQAVPTTNTAHTIGDALNGARAQAFGNWINDGNGNFTLYASDGTTVVHTFTLSPIANPTRRIT